LNIIRFNFLRSTNKQQAYTRCVHARTCLQMRVSEMVVLSPFLVALLLFLLDYLLKNLLMFYLLGRGMGSFASAKSLWYFFYFLFFWGFFFFSSS
jgi:hypothetical protein